MEKTKWIVPFQRDVFEREPAVVRGMGRGRANEERGEKGVETRKEKREVGKAWAVDLFSWWIR